MSKVVVKKDHDLGITVNQRWQKSSELVCMIPAGVGNSVEEVVGGQ